MYCALSVVVLVTVFSSTRVTANAAYGCVESKLIKGKTVKGATTIVDTLEECLEHCRQVPGCVSINYNTKKKCNPKTRLLKGSDKSHSLWTYCPRDYDPCEGVKCKNGGQCSEGSCVCTDEYFGDKCQFMVPLKDIPCKPNPCLNGGSCSGDNVCTCLDGFLGDKCQNKDPCNPDPCQNGGVCSAGSCTCPDGYSGNQCETKDPCLGVECQNGGVCSAGSCNCPDGYSGNTCETKDPCLGVECQNGGVCSGGSCSCPDGFEGSRCETKTPTTTAKNTNCGGHMAVSCKECPEGNGAAWCNGDCAWSDGQCVDKGSTGSSCPASHPYVYHDGDYCCASNTEKVYAPEGERCDGGPISFTSSCCKDDQYVACSTNICSNNDQDDSKEGWGFIESQSMPGMCIDVDGLPGMSNGADIHLWSCEKNMASTSDQVWKRKENGQVVSRPSGKCMDIVGFCSNLNLLQIHLWECEAPGFPNSDHFWDFEYHGDYFRIKNKCTGKCVDVDGWSAANNGQNIHQWSCENWGQRDTGGWFPSNRPSDHWWKFVPVTF